MRKRQILEILDNITIKGCECDPEINFHCTIHSEVAILKDLINTSVIIPRLDKCKAITKNIHCVK